MGKAKTKITRKKSPNYSMNTSYSSRTTARRQRQIKKSNKLLLGLPASGKTTFLAALWQLLFHDIPLKSHPFKLTPLPSERQYLEEIRDRWIDCQEVYHTPEDDRQNVKLHFQRTKDKKQLSFSLLDVSGEIFRKCWVDRRWDSEFDNYVQGVDGIILFINPLKLIYPNTLNEVYEVFYDVFLEPNGYPFDMDSWFEGEAIPFQVKQWDADDSPSQVKLIELLQIVKNRCQKDCRLMVIVSAWDTIQYYNIAPLLWVAKRLPLLMQYIISNFSYVKNQFKCFGISAQGADYHNYDLQKLAQLETSERIIVVKEKNEPGSMFDILQWICE